MALAVMAGAALGQAQDQSQGRTKYIFWVGSGFLCESTDSPACPAAARVAQGENYEFSGAGSFNVADKKMTGAGTYTHKLSNGRVVETGVWTAEELVSFVLYGTAPGALLRERHASEKMLPDPRQAKMRMLSEPMPTGGLAVFRIQLQSTTGGARKAMLQVNCALGDVPRERSVEGIRITLESNNSEYSEETSGRVMFLALRPEVSTPAKVPEQDARPEVSEQPQE
jgi:hypothetical protein